MDRLILDTGVLVAAVRGRAAVPNDADVAIPAVVIAEYLAGVHLDQDAGRQAAQRAFLEEVLAVIPIPHTTGLWPSTMQPRWPTPPDKASAEAPMISSSPPPAALSSPLTGTRGSTSCPTPTHALLPERPGLWQAVQHRR